MMTAHQHFPYHPLTTAETGTLSATVSLSGASSEDVTVNYATSNGTANAGNDYTSTTGTLTIAAGETSGTIDISILADSVSEEDETFNVTLTSSVFKCVSWHILRYYDHYR